MSMLAKDLTVTVKYIEGQGRFKVATEVKIWLGPLLIASKTLGGQYSQRQALDDFRRNHRDYTTHDGYEAAMKLVA